MVVDTPDSRLVAANLREIPKKINQTLLCFGLAQAPRFGVPPRS